MNRRRFVVAALAAVVTGSAAFASGTVDDVVNEMAAQGYKRIEVSQTLLGRTRILAVSANGSREVVINGRTGEILRDYSQRTTPQPGRPERGSGGASSRDGSSSPRSNGARDERDERDERDDRVERDDRDDRDEREDRDRPDREDREKRDKRERRDRDDD